MATPLGAQPAPSVQAGWAVAKPGKSATLTVQGVSLLTTTVTATWTSAPMTFKQSWSGIDVNIAWASNGSPTTGPSTQVVRIRFSNSKGKWGPWKTLNATRLATSTPDLGGDGKDYDLGYPGKTPAKNISVQVALTDTLAPGTELQQTLSVDA